MGMVFIALVVFWPGTVYAASEGGDSGKLDLFKGALDLTIYTIVVFLILFFLLGKFAWPQIAEGLDRREHSIAHEKHEAEKARKEAADLRSQLQAEMARVNDEIRQMMDKARQDAQQTAADELARSKTELQAERERLYRDLQISTDDALHRIWEQAAQLATLISTKAVRKQLTMEDHRGLIAEALAEFRSSAQARRQEIEEAHS